MNITTRKRRDRKGVKWINHHYSQWYRARLAFGNVMGYSVALRCEAQIRHIQSTSAKTKQEKINKAAAIAQAVINMNIAINKAKMIFI